MCFGNTSKGKYSKTILHGPSQRNEEILLKENAGGGIRGGKQDAMFDGGNAHFEANFPELDFIIDARVVEDAQR